MRSTTDTGSWTAVVRAVVVRPELWVTAVGQVFRLSPTDWWRRPPFVPVPDPAYVRFRLATQYGGIEGARSAAVGAHGAPDPHDVVEYLEWCRSIAVPRGGPPSPR